MTPDQKAVLAHVVADPDAWWAHCREFARGRYELDAPARSRGRALVAGFEMAAALADDAVRVAYEAGDGPAAMAAEQSLKAALAAAATAASRVGPLELTAEERAQAMLAEKVARHRVAAEAARALPGYKTRAERDPEALAAELSRQEAKARREARAG